MGPSCNRKLEHSVTCIVAQISPPYKAFLWRYQRKQHSTKMSRFIPAKAFGNSLKPAISATPFACLLKAFTL